MPNPKVRLSKASKRIIEKREARAAESLKQKQLLADLAEAKVRAELAEQKLKKLPLSGVAEQKEPAADDADPQLHADGPDSPAGSESNSAEIGKLDNYSNLITFPPRLNHPDLSDDYDAVMDVDEIVPAFANRDQLLAIIDRQAAELAKSSEQNAQLSIRFDGMKSSFDNFVKSSENPVQKVGSDSPIFSIPQSVQSAPSTPVSPVVRRVQFGALSAPVTPLGVKTSDKTVPINTLLAPTDLTLDITGDIPEFLKQARIYYTLAESDPKEATEARKAPTASITKPNDNGQLKRFILSIDTKRHAGWPRGAAGNYTFLNRLVLAEGIAEPIRTFFDSWLNGGLVTDWDACMSSLWNSFYSANEPAKIKHQLEVARQRTDQSVQSFYTWIRDMAARANITDDLQLGGYMTNGLLPHVTDNCNHYDIPPAGWTLDGCLRWATAGERAYSSKNLRNHREKVNERKRKNLEPNSTTVAAIKNIQRSERPADRPKPAAKGNYSQGAKSLSKPEGTPNGILYMFEDRGRKYLHSCVKDHRKAHKLCLRCGKSDHGDCKAPNPRIDPKYIKVVGRDDHPDLSARITSIFAAVLDDDSRVAMKVYLSADNVSEQKVLLDSGACYSYVDPQMVTKLGLSVNNHPLPYYPLGADGKRLDEVRHQVVLKIGFGTHVESFLFDVLPIGGLDFVLGRDWLSVHDVILPPSKGFYPLFRGPHCKEHILDNSDVVQTRIKVSPRIDLLSVRFVTIEPEESSELHQAPDSSPLSSANGTVGPSPNFTPVNEPRPSTPIHEVSGDGQEEQPEQPLKKRRLLRRKNKPKKPKRVFRISYIENSTRTKRILVMKFRDTVVHVVRNIADDHEDSDNYFSAFVSPLRPSFASVPTGNESAQSTATPEIPEEYRDLAAAFADGSMTLPDHGPHDLTIELVQGKSPRMGALYNMSANELEIVQKYIKDMISKGLIRPSKSPCGAPVLFAKKKDGTLRLCVDYRRLNDVTVKNVYPLPLIDEILDRLAGSRLYTALDLKDAYWLIRIKEGDEWKTAFRTRYGLFEYLIMPFGLTNAPSAFQAHVNECFSDMIDLFVQIYLDDFLIYSKTRAEHVAQVRRVLQRCIDHKLRINLKKCTFHTESVQFLGYQVTPGGVNMCQDRVKAIDEWKEPTDLTSLQSFLGFCNFYRNFVRNYSELATPLTNLTRKDRAWEWTSVEQSSFDALKAQFRTADIMRHFDAQLPVVLETDASDFALGAVLSQEHPDGVHPVGFYSRKLKAAELNYDTHDKELLAIIEALKGWRHFCMGTKEPVKVLTDHMNLKYFTTTKDLNRRQVRWSQFLSDYNLQLVHRPGKLNPQADGLSRRVQDELSIGDRLAQQTCLLPPKMFAAINAKPENQRYNTIERLVKEAYEKDTYLQGVLDWLGSFGDDDRPPYPPNSGKIRRKCQDDDLDVGDNGFHWDKELLLFDDHLYIPESVRLMLLATTHDSPLSGHAGIRKTLELLQRDFWWPGLPKMVEDYVKSCDICQRTKPSRRTYGLLQPLPAATERWVSVTMDFMTQLPPCGGFETLLVVVDRFTKMAHFIPCGKQVDSRQTAKLYIDRVFRLHGIPKEIISDRGGQFNAGFAKSFWKTLGVDQKLSTAFHPETDGQTERVNSVVNQYLRAYTTYKQDNWVDLLPVAEFAYNNTVHTATGVSPFFANAGIHPNSGSGITKGLSDNPQDLALEMENLSQFLSHNLEIARADMKRFADRHRTESPLYEVGDQVMLSTLNFPTSRPKAKWSDKWIGPIKVIAVYDNGCIYKLALPKVFKGHHSVFHVSLLRPYRQNPIPNRVQADPLPPDIIDGNEEYEVERIVDSRTRRGQLQYRVRFQGYNADHDEWLPVDNLQHAETAIKAYEAQEVQASLDKGTTEPQRRRPVSKRARK